MNKYQNAKIDVHLKMLGLLEKLDSLYVKETGIGQEFIKTELEIYQIINYLQPKGK